MKWYQAALKALLYPIAYPFVSMPGRTHTGAVPSLSEDERQMRAKLEQHVRVLSSQIGERSLRRGLEETVAYLEGELKKLGYEVGVQEFVLDGFVYKNLEVEIAGTASPREVLVIGAHYDTQFDTPGADDNGTGVAALLELARLLKDSHPGRTLRLVFFANEEHPLNLSGWEQMGSWFYAKRCRQRNENIVGMFSLEMLGVYSDEEGSQKYPAPFNLFYPSRGNFIGFVGNYRSRKLVRKAVSLFRRLCAFPCEGVAAPELVRDIGRSDHWGFWQFGYQALMITDTSNFRYPLYHTPEDTIDKIDFERFARVTSGVKQIVREFLAR